jgi:type II secretory pathway predicted ATPase ExeA
MPAEPSSRSAKPPALDDLLRAWGLRRTPFASDDKGHELFATATHRETLSLLDTTAALRGVMMLTGTPGAGKSTLIKSWLAGLELKRFLPLLITQSSLSATGVLEVLLAKLGERARFKRSTNLLLLEKHLADLEPVTLVLVLDDAQNFPGPALEELRLLLGLGGRQRSAFALVLLGDDYLLGSLRLSVQRALFSRISAATSLAPLPREDIAAYLDWHVSRAGLDRDICSASLRLPPGHTFELPCFYDCPARRDWCSPPPPLICWPKPAKATPEPWAFWPKPPGLPPHAKTRSPSKPTTSTPPCARCPPPTRKSNNLKSQEGSARGLTASRRALFVAINPRR